MTAVVHPAVQINRQRAATLTAILLLLLLLTGFLVGLKIAGSPGQREAPVMTPHALF